MLIVIFQSVIFFNRTLFGKVRIINHTRRYDIRVGNIDNCYLLLVPVIWFFKIIMVWCVWVKTWKMVKLLYQLYYMTMPIVNKLHFYTKIINNNFQGELTKSYKGSLKWSPWGDWWNMKRNWWMKIQENWGK